MIALYSVGNVKRELKKIGRKLYIRDFAKFIFAYIEEDKLSLLTVQKITDDRWQIIHFYAEKIQKNNEDINFYQEILYRFYKEQERENIKYLVINFAKQKQQILHYSFPRMPLSEIKKALYWELQEDIKLEEYYYTYTLEDAKENYNLKVNLIGKNLVYLWQQLAKEQNLNLYSVFCQNDVKIDVIAEDEYIKRYRVEKQSDIFNCGKKVIKFITGKENVEQIGEICACYNIVHSFILNEYFLDGFLPENGKVILDCGAAMGDTAIVFADQYPDSKIYSFECIEKNIELLNKNLELNNISNVIPINVFLSSKTGKINIDSIEYDSISIDDYVKKNNINNIGLIKFDIEGAELEALNGGINTIKKHKPLLYIPIYHLETDIYEIPKFIYNLGLRTKFGLKWVEKRIWGVDCVLFCKFV